MSTDRSEVIWEAYPGATNDIDRLAQDAGGWVCERHPSCEFPHDDCAGPGMLRADADCEHGYLAAGGTATCPACDAEAL